MAIILSKYAAGLIAVAYPSIAGAAVVTRYSHTLSAAPDAGDILDLGIIPAGTRVADIVIDCDDLDTSGAPTIVADVGIMSGDVGSEDVARTCGSEFFPASTLLQSGGAPARAATKGAFRTTKAAKERSIGVKFTAAAAAFAPGVIGITVTLVAD